MKTIIPDYRQHKDPVSYTTNTLFEQVKKEEHYVAEATEFIDSDLRMKEQPFESPGKKLTVARFIYY